MMYVLLINVDTDDRQSGEKRIIDFMHGVPADEDDPPITSFQIRPLDEEDSADAEARA
jgi:hypothetical protein